MCRPATQAFSCSDLLPGGFASPALIRLRTWNKPSSSRLCELSSFRACHSIAEVPSASFRALSRRRPGGDDSKATLFFCEESSIDRQMTNRLILWSLAVSLFFAVSIAAFAQTATPTPSEGATQNMKPLDPAAATQAWLATVPKEKREKSDAYFEGGYWLILWNFLLAGGISVFLLISRISARLRDFAERICRGSLFPQVVIYAIPYFLLVAALSFPLAAYQYFYREHQYGLATQSFMPWFREQLI